MRTRGSRNQSTLDMIEHIRQAIAIFKPRTVRGLHYYFVRGNILPNTKQTYRAVVNACKAAREDGAIEWDDIVDPGREPYRPLTFEDLADYVDNAPDWYKLDLWREQDTRPILWVEKAAQIAPLEVVARRHRVRLYFGRGYDSWTSLKDLSDACAEDESTVLVFGDHDPSGLQIPEALQDFLARRGSFPTVTRIALTMEQIKERGLPPQRIKDDDWQRTYGDPRKKKGDPRAEAYKQTYGAECWELDALDPGEIQALAEEAIEGCITDPKAIKRVKSREKRERQRITEALATIGGDE